MRAVITVTGTDRCGIIAKVSNFLYERKINIEDISQTVLGEQFAMIMIVDLAESGESISALARGLEQAGEEIGMSVRLQHEDLFNAMHKI